MSFSAQGKNNMEIAARSTYYGQSENKTKCMKDFKISTRFTPKITYRTSGMFVPFCTFCKLCHQQHVKKIIWFE